MTKQEHSLVRNYLPEVSLFVYFEKTENCFIFHATSKLAKTTFNKFTPPPPKKKWPFFLGGGGVSFLECFHEFLGLGHKKKFGKTLAQSQCFGIIIGQFRPLPAIL